MCSSDYESGKGGGQVKGPNPPHPHSKLKTVKYSYQKYVHPQYKKKYIPLPPRTHPLLPPKIMQTNHDPPPYVFIH